MWCLIGITCVVVIGIAYAAYYMTKEYQIFDDWENYD